MRLVRLALLVAAAAFAAVIVWAMGRASISESFGRIVADPWGLVSLIDLYSGFVVAAFVIALSERRAVALPLIAALFVLGNPVTLVWLAWRLPELAGRLKG